MSIQETIQNKEFMDEFIQTANEVYQYSGDYKNVYGAFEDRLSDDEILELLDYCEDNNLLSD
jgi:hypothetical protein